MLESTWEENTITKIYTGEPGISKLSAHPARRNKNRACVKRAAVDRTKRQGVQRVMLVEIECAGVFRKYSKNFSQQRDVFRTWDMMENASGESNVKYSRFNRKVAAFEKH